MATAFQEQEAPDSGEQVSEAIDYESEARKMGWAPKEEFKGDPARHVDAETFYNRAQEILPIAQATIKKLTSKIDRMEKDFAKASEFFSKSEERGYQRAMDEIKARKEAAVESGDLDAFRKADKEADELRAEMTGKTAPSDDDGAQRAEEFADWALENKWYEANNPVIAPYADSIAQALSKKRGGFLTQADLVELSEKVTAKFSGRYPELFGGEEPATPRQKKPMVDGGGQRQGTRGGNTFNDLPADAKAACDRWVKSGIIKDRDAYVKEYFAKG